MSSAGPKAACQLTGGALSPPRGLFGPRLPALGLQAAGWCLVLALTGQDISPVAAAAVFTGPNVPQCICHRRLCPQGEPQPPPTSAGDPPRTAGRSGPGSHQLTASALGPGACEVLCGPLGVGSLLPRPVRPLQSSPAVFAARGSGGSRRRTPGLGSPTWGSELSLLGGNLCRVIILQRVGRPPGGKGLLLSRRGSCCCRRRGMRGWSAPTSREGP